MKYPFAPLAAAMCMTPAAAARELGLSGKTWKEYRDEGMSEKVADRMAVKAGLHPFIVWPELAEDIIGKTEEFDDIQQQNRQSARRLRQAAWVRERYRNDPNFRAAKVEANRRYRQQAVASLRAKKARYRAAHALEIRKKDLDYKDANRERIRAQRRAYYQANRERELARQRAYDARKRGSAPIEPQATDAMVA